MDNNNNKRANNENTQYKNEQQEREVNEKYFVSIRPAG